LENLSWRLWTRETFCVQPGYNMALPTPATLPKNIEAPRRPSSDDMPQLSGSVESVADEEAVEFTTESAPMEIIRPRIRRQDSCASSRSRGKERHITSDDLEKMVVSIVTEKEPLTAPLPEIAAPFTATVVVPEPAVKEVSPPPPALQRSGSTTTESPSKSPEVPSLDSDAPSSPELPSSRSRTTVVRGFAPSPIVACHTIHSAPKSSSDESIPKPRSSPAAKFVQPKKQPAKFALGESSCEDSLSDQSHSMAARKQPVPPPKRKMFQVGGSSEEESSLKSALHLARGGALLNMQKKQTSFSNQLVTRTVAAPAVIDEDQSETEADYVDESAIDDDDDSSDWEDSLEDSGRASIDEKQYFQRVDSKLNLPRGRSLITLMIERSESEKVLANAAAAQPTVAGARGRAAHHQQHHQQQPLVASPNDSDDSPLMMRRGTRTTPLRPINEVPVPRSAAQPIMTTTNGVQHQAALSPRTTRRNMLSTELTESLRRHLLWERSQKSSTANAVLKRRHTSHDVANLRQYPERVHMSKDTDVNANSWNQYLTRDAWNGYHSKGW